MLQAILYFYFPRHLRVPFLFTVPVFPCQPLHLPKSTGKRFSPNYPLYLKMMEWGQAEGKPTKIMRPSFSLYLKLSPPLNLDPGVDAVYPNTHQVQ